MHGVGERWERVQTKMFMRRAPGQRKVAAMFARKGWFGAVSRGADKEAGWDGMVM